MEDQGLYRMVAAALAGGRTAEQEPEEEAEDCDSRRGAVQHQRVSGTVQHDYLCFERGLV